MSPATADLLDAHANAQAAELQFRDYGGVARFHGPLVAIKVFEDNALVKTLLDEPGCGRVLVIDGALRCAAP